MEQDVKDNLGPLHAKIVNHIFTEVRESIRNMNILYIANFGTFGPNRRKVKKACREGWLKTEEKRQICKELEKL